MESLLNIAGVWNVVLMMIVAVGVVWILPIPLGVRKAKKKNYSPAWMCFGIYPLGGWIMYAVLCGLRPKIQCESCGGFVTDNFRMCPFCHQHVRLPD